MPFPDSSSHPAPAGALSHVLWIGGATDAGKSTVADMLAERHGLQVYHYDRRDLAHHERLAATSATYRAWLDASLDERWVYPEPEELLAVTLRSFRDRFPLVIEDLLAFPTERHVVAEGFGLLPEYVVPLLASHSRGLWLVPTDEFKRASMLRRNKPSFAARTSDPGRARRNLLARDMLLAAHIREQARQLGCTLYEIDGVRSIDGTVAMAESHFAPFLRG